MEWRHEEKFRKLKADHDQLEACMKHPHDDEQFAYTMPEHTKGESNPQHTVNTQDDPSFSHLHHLEGRTTRWHPFIIHIMEVDILLGFKPLNLERYDGTVDLDKYFDYFLT